MSCRSHPNDDTEVLRNSYILNPIGPVLRNCPKTVSDALNKECNISSSPRMLIYLAECLETCLVLILLLCIYILSVGILPRPVKHSLTSQLRAKQLYSLAKAEADELHPSSAPPSHAIKSQQTYFSLSSSPPYPLPNHYG